MENLIQKQTDTKQTEDASQVLNSVNELAKYAAYFCLREEDITNEVFSGKPSNIKYKPTSGIDKTVYIFEFDCKYYVKKNEKITQVRDQHVTSSFTKNADTWILSTNYKSNDKKTPKDTGSKDSIVIKRQSVLDTLNTLQLLKKK